MTSKNFLSSMRVVAGCALLGAVLSSILFGWVNIPGDIRSYGAALGAIAGVASKVYHSAS